MRASATGSGVGQPANLGPGDAFLHLTALIPNFNSLRALTRPTTPATGAVLAGDPAALLLLLRDGQAEELRADNLLTHLARPELLTRALVLLADASASFYDPTLADVAPIHAAMLRLAQRAEDLARTTQGRVDPLRARLAGMFAPLGWLTVATVDPVRAGVCRAAPEHRAAPLMTQARHWGLDQDALARRLARRWRLPSWLADIQGRLRLNADIVADLGAARGLFEVVRQAAIDVAREGYDLGLVPIDPREIPPAPVVASVREWRDPRAEPLLPELLRLALENRLLAGNTVSARTLEDQNDRLHGALVLRLEDEGERLRSGRLEALAEMAAGAGHEINNPLAVISGQAQYLLARRERSFQPEALDSVVPALETIVGQTRRIHTLLRQMMLFARPPEPRFQTVSLGPLLVETARKLEDPAKLRRVRIEVVSPEPAILLSLDAELMRTALTALLRNAIEAVPADGWVRIGSRRSEPAGPVEVVVEDSGPGPLPEQVPFLFDPFYSGREAGRGKGLGLPVAWQLVRQHGGELRYVRPEGGPTRFIVRLPGTPSGVSEQEGNSGEAA